MHGLGQHRPMSKIVLRAVGAGALFSLFTGLVGCQGQPEPTADAKAAPAPRPVPETITVEARAYPKTLSYVGTVVAPRDAVLAAVRGGRVNAYNYEIGQAFKANAVLVELGAIELAFASQAMAASATQAAARIAGAKEPASLPSALVAKSAYGVAVDAVQRGEKLYAQGSLSQQELTRLRANEASAKAQYEGVLLDAQAEFGRYKELMASAGQARAALADQSVRAPFDGVVLERFVEVGQMASAGGALVRVIDPAELRVRFDVPQFDAGRVMMGGKVTLLADGKKYTATVVRSTPGLVGEANSRLVEATIDGAGSPTAPVLLPGARYPIWLEIEGTEQLVEVPAASTTSVAGIHRAWVVEEGRLRERLLSVARFEGDHLLVREGLKGGDRLVKTPDVTFRLGETVADGAPATTGGTK